MLCWFGCVKSFPKNLCRENAACPADPPAALLLVRRRRLNAEGADCLDDDSLNLIKCGCFRSANSRFTVSRAARTRAPAFTVAALPRPHVQATVKALELRLIRQIPGPPGNSSAVQLD
jgi:hypothetical protein